MRNQPPREQPRTVVIDPRVSFGRPVIAGTGIPTAVLAPEEAVWDAIRCELDLDEPLTLFPRRIARQRFDLQGAGRNGRERRAALEGP